LVPAIVPTKDEAADPIGVRRTSAPSSSGSAPQRVLPEDLPAVLMSGRSGSPGTSNSGRATQAPSPSADTSDAADSLEATKQNLQDYQRQLQRLLDDLTKTASGGASQPTSSSRTSARKGRTESRASSGTSGEGLFGGQLQASATPRITASTLGNRSLTLPKGTAFTCALKTKLISVASGFVSCQTQRNVYGDDGRVLLVERGSHIDGEYRNTSVHPGTVRIPVLWTRIRTPNGVTMNIESPGTGPLGESGVDGYVDNRWVERIGAAILLSLVDDAVTLVGQKQSDGQSTVVLPATTANTDKLAEKVLDSTINIPPLIYNNQGGIVGIYVARDVDFSSVYELKAVQP
jgi:type IV secretion system protein VirB10